MQKINDEEGDAFPFEKARIIAGIWQLSFALFNVVLTVCSEIELAMADRILAQGQENFPRWLHVLMPKVHESAHVFMTFIRRKSWHSVEKEASAVTVISGRGPCRPSVPVSALFCIPCSPRMTSVYRQCAAREAFTANDVSARSAPQVTAGGELNVAGYTSLLCSLVGTGIRSAHLKPAHRTRGQNVQSHGDHPDKYMHLGLKGTTHVLCLYRAASGHLQSGTGTHRM